MPLYCTICVSLATYNEYTYAGNVELELGPLILGLFMVVIQGRLIYDPVHLAYI